jgi:hypothetical protein
MTSHTMGDAQKKHKQDSIISPRQQGHLIKAQD